MRTADGSPPWLEVTAISADSGEVVWRGGNYLTAAWTDDPDRVVAWTSDGLGVVLDVRDGRVVRSLEGHLYGYPPDGTSVPPGGHHLLGWSESYANDESAWAVWDLRTGAQILLRTLPPGGRGSLTQDGRLVVMVQHGGDLAAYDVVSPNAAVAAPVVRRPDVVAAAVSPTGVVAAVRADGRLGFHQARTLEPLGPPLPQTPGQVEQLAFSRDGRLLVTRSTTGEVRLFDTGARTQLGEPIELGLDRTRSVALSPDGQALAVRTDEGIRVWDLRPARWSRAMCTLVRTQPDARGVGDVSAVRGRLSAQLRLVARSRRARSGLALEGLSSCCQATGQRRRDWGQRPGGTSSVSRWTTLHRTAGHRL